LRRLGKVLLKVIRKLANYVAKTKFASKAIHDHADLREIREKKNAKIYVGIFLMCFSYIIAFPGIGLFGALSIYWNEPRLIVIGGPLLYIINLLVFAAGVYLAGGKYFMVIFRWLTRVTLEKIIN